MEYKYLNISLVIIKVIRQGCQLANFHIYSGASAFCTKSNFANELLHSGHAG